VSTGGVFMDTWFGISGNGISDLRNASGFPDAPDESVVVQTTEAPSGRADNYGVRLRTYVAPPESDEYTFWIASDDNGELWMAPNEEWDDLALIATVSAYTGARDWTYSAEQRSRSMFLRAGHPYALEALMKEGGGGDHLSVAWSRGDGEPSLIPAEFLFVEPPEPPPEPEPDMGMPATDMGMSDSDMRTPNLDMNLGPQDMSSVEMDVSITNPDDGAPELDMVVNDAFDLGIDGGMTTDMKRQGHGGCSSNRMLTDAPRTVLWSLFVSLLCVRLRRIRKRNGRRSVGSTL